MVNNNSNSNNINNGGGNLENLFLFLLEAGSQRALAGLKLTEVLLPPPPTTKAEGIHSHMWYSTLFKKAKTYPVVLKNM